MNSRAITLALRLLTSACAGAALGTLTGCPLFFACPDPWSDVEIVELGTTADILALTRGGDYDELVAVGVGGVVVHYDIDGAVVSNPTNVTLRGVAANGPTVVVGDGGTILSSDDRGATWVARDSGTTDALLAITYAGELGTTGYHVAIAAEGVLYSSDGAQTWTLVAPPAAGWGGLRAVWSSGDAVWVVGANGSAWSTNDPAGAWLREDLGTSEDLIGGGRVSGDDATSYVSAIAVATRTQVYYRDYRDANASEWTIVAAGFDGDIAAYGGGFVVTVNGSVYDISESGTAERVANVGLTPTVISGGWEGFMVGGEGGNAARAYFQVCVGGRPWRIDGEVVTARLAKSASAEAWTAGVQLSAVDGVVDRLDPGLRERLAVAWGRDGQFEHASIASFARFVTELLQLGAPPELVLAGRRAVADEIDHARRCFALSSRYAGRPIGPGPLPLARTRPGERASPEAIALAVFEEGCVNESVAAAEAAIAASEARDPMVRLTLERIAADEREHAALAWKTLRWLLDRYTHEVAPALRRAVLGLTAPLADAKAAPGAGSPLARQDLARTKPALDLDPAQAQLLRDHGRLPASERAAIHRKVFAELIVPLSRELLGGTVRAQA